VLSMFKLTDQNTAKSAIRFADRKLGLEIHRSDPVGHEPFMDMRRLSGSRRGTVIFDVGANAGQTIKRFSEAFESPVIHAFEPSQQTFADLQRNTRLGSVNLNNFALGAEPGTLVNENTISDMSSFHELGPDGWGSIQRRISVEVKTIDDYCVQNRISSIDILKSDTQGFDLEVLKAHRDASLKTESTSSISRPPFREPIRINRESTKFSNFSWTAVLHPLPSIGSNTKTIERIGSMPSL
jgi:FkbM family methyltransferase